MQSNSPLPESKNSAGSTDAELLRAIRQGKVEALGNLYDRYARLVYSLALKILANSQEAEDLTQEIFLALWKRDTYNPDRGSFSSFLTTVTRSRAIDRLRSRSSRNRFLQRWQALAQSEPSGASPLEQASLGERSQLVRDALAQLPEPERQVLEIAYYEGLSQSQIAKRLNTPLGTVKTRSRQGLLKLRQTLQDYF